MGSLSRRSFVGVGATAAAALALTGCGGGGSASSGTSEGGGINEDTTTVAVGAVVLAHDRVAEEDVYALAYDIFEDPAALVESHAKYAEVSAEKGASITAVPYHPGAARYFEEKGLSVEAKTAPSVTEGEPMGTGTALEFVTGGESGTYYAFGSVIAQHATNTVGVNVTAVAGNGSQANVQQMQDGVSDLAFCQSDVMAYAYDGTNLFADAGAVDCFSTLGCLYDEQVQIVTCDPEIKTVADLEGKNVSIGAAGSGVYFNAIDILEVYGLTESDINPTYQNFADSANDLKDGKIDAAFIVAGAPTTAITDLSTSKQAYLVSLDDEHISQLLEKSPYYSKATIPAGTY